MADFEEAYKITMAHEGGYSNDPVDVGGETYRGISRRFHPSWDGWKYVDNQKPVGGGIKEGVFFPKLEPKVMKFYKMMYWDLLRGDNIPDQHIAEELFDTGVNMGIGRASRFLQMTLNCLNRNGVLYEDLVEDGKIGPKTLQALNILLPKEASLIFKILNVLQGSHYMDYMRSSPAQQRFARGWFNRVTFYEQWEQE